MSRSEPDDRTRFEALYGGSRADLLAYFLRRVEQSADAADLLTETFLVAWRRIDRVPAGPDGRLWLFGVARKVLANHRRAERTGQQLATTLRGVLTVQAGHRAGSEPDTATVLAVRAALDRLTPADREVMMLTAYEEFTPGEIAHVTGRSAASVRVRLHRARRRVAADLNLPAEGRTGDGGAPWASVVQLRDSTSTP